MFLRTLTLVLLSSGPCLAETIAVRAGHLIDPATGAVIENQVILVQDGKITKVGSSTEIPDGSQVVDLSHAWVLPGLMDAHAHLTLEFPASGELSWAKTYSQESTGLRALRGVHNARIVLEAGFTTIKDIGNSANYADTDMRKAIERGWFPGPTILNAGKIIAPFGGQIPNVTFEQGPMWQYEYIDADSPDELRKAVRRNIYYGASTIKLVTDSARYFYSEEEVRAAVEEAHKAGLTLSIHSTADQPTRNAILAGVDSIEHGFALSDQVLKLMKEHGTFLVGTDFPLEHLKIIFGLKEAQELDRQIGDRLRRAHRLGVKMAFGSDVVGSLPGKNRADMMLDYVARWRDAGVPAAEILKAMTTHTAELMGIEDQRGAIRLGLAADIIAMPENPLENIEALRGIHFVMKNGAIIKHEAQSPRASE
jgi:imidazolonepropionase-like amidohydrolase